MFLCTSEMAEFQVVLYESTNIIENHLINVPTCEAWVGGMGTQGIINVDGSDAFFVPGRNPSAFIATNESYRYELVAGVPFVVNWSNNQGTITTGDTMSFFPDSTSTIISEYTTCAGQQIFDSVVIVVDNPDIDVTVSQVDSGLSANASDMDYQWVDCDNNYTPVVGETGQNFSPSLDGSYAVVITSGGCVDTSDCYNVMVSDIIENPLHFDIQVYPNPTSSNVIIELNQSNPNIEIELLNLTGQSIFQKSFSNQRKFELDLEGVTAGLYFLRIDFSGEMKTVKLVVNEK
jgi:hypothetical protein